MRDSQINAAPAGFDPFYDFPKGFYDFYLPLHKHFTPWQQELSQIRKGVLAASHAGRPPDYLPDSQALGGDWKIDLPDWIVDQRNQMTGPADDAELVVKMLNSGAPGVMLDLEDSMKNSWNNWQMGVENILSTLKGELTYADKNANFVGIKPSKTVIFSRPRGLHLSQAGVTADPLTSASLLDVAYLAYQINPSALAHPLTFYIPKSESAKEALWWRDLFLAIEKARGWNTGAIKAMALVEAFPMAYEIEEFIYNLRDHIVGLNLGRWDYMASLIHYHLHDPDWVLPDRNTIPHDVRFFQNIRMRIPDICHKRGILAIGGMTALFPSRADMILNERALSVLSQDKKNEADCLMDGAWTGHPDQNDIAMEQFPVPNQGFTRPQNIGKKPDLRCPPIDVGKRTLQGTKDAVRTTILYRYGVLNGKGASLISGYMEDLATDRIYRLMIAQRVKHNAVVTIVGDEDRPILHTPELITNLYDMQLQGILADLPDDATDNEIALYKLARKQSEQMIVDQQFDPV